MNKINLSIDNIEKYKDLIESFFNNNILSYDFFHPHDLSYNGLYKEIKEHVKDIYILFINHEKICGYGMLRGWDKGYKIPSLGILIDKNERGKDTSYKLMNELHFLAKKMNCKKVRLTVSKKNIQAINLYKKMNYEFSDLNDNNFLGFKTL